MNYSRMIKVASATIAFGGSFMLLKKFQDGRYLAHDAQKMASIQVAERDVEKMKRKYNISEEELAKHASPGEGKRIEPTLNEIESNPNWENLRAPRKFGM